MDVRNRQEDITAFSTIETINVIPVGILYLDSRGRPLLMNRCMRKNLVELHMPTDLGDMSGTWNDLRKLSMQMPEGGKNRVRINLTALVRRVRWSRFLPPRFACLCAMALWSRAVRSSA